MFYFLFFRRVRLSRAIAEGLLCRCCRLRANWSFTPLTIKPPGTIVIFSGPKEHVNSHVRASYVAVFIAVLFYSVQFIECKCSIFIFYRWDNVWRCGQLLTFFCSFVSVAFARPLQRYNIPFTRYGHSPRSRISRHGSEGEPQAFWRRCQPRSRQWLARPPRTSSVRHVLPKIPGPSAAISD